jgi:hypothetical protein
MGFREYSRQQVVDAQEEEALLVLETRDEMLRHDGVS